MKMRERERARDATTLSTSICEQDVFDIFFVSISGQHSSVTINEKLINLINASNMARKIEKKFINLVGDSLSLLLGPLSCVLILR